MWKAIWLVWGLLGAPLLAQGSGQGLGRAWMDLGQPSGNALFLKLDACGVTIAPSEDGHVRIRYTGRRERDLSTVRLRFRPEGNPASLRLEHDLRDDFQIELQVPRVIALTLKMSAGEVVVQGVEGDKDLRLHAGEIRVHVGDPNLYGPVSASVWAGEVDFGPFGESKEGLFRNAYCPRQGRYSLHARVKAGEVAFQK